MATIKERWRAFRQWQQRPYEVAPLSSESHTCATCGTQYEGNYCPRCGQSARVGRYSFKKAILLFLDVWGLGNRSMFRSLRDLLLRPGYMIRDYLNGMQMAYFPPFKMFFLLTTLSLIVAGGLNIKGVNTLKEKRVSQTETVASRGANGDTPTESIATSADDASAESKAIDGTNANSSPQKQKITEFKNRVKQWSHFLADIQLKFPSICSLYWLTLLSGFLYIFFRKSPAIPDLRYSEFLVALVYISNMYSIYATTLDFLCIDERISALSLVTTLVPLKQLSGFCWWRVICYSTLSLILMIAAIIVLIVAGALIISAHYLL